MYWRLVQKRPCAYATPTPAHVLAHGPSGGDSGVDNSLCELVNDNWKSKKTVIFAAQSLDYLYSVYIWYFQKFYTGEKSKIARQLMVNPLLIKLLESTFEPFIRRRHECYDPYLRTVLKTAMSNYLKSVRLYPLGHSTLTNEVPGPYDIFCTTDELGKILQQVGSDVSVLFIGRTNPDVAVRIQQIGCSRAHFLRRRGMEERVVACSS
jgi:hypothetical protein